LVIEPIDAKTVSKITVSFEKCKVALELLLLISSFLQANRMVISRRGRRHFFIILYF